MTKTKQYVKEAVEIQKKEGNSSKKALKKYEEAIAHFTDEDDEYELLYAHYQSMWIYASLDNIDKSVPHAKKCMELMDKTIRAGAIAHFTAMGKFYEEVIRFSTNIIAWNAYVKKKEGKELEEALETISMGCEYVDSPDSFFLFDTKVRILLRLKRKDEAYRIVNTCLKKSPNFSDFSDIKKDRDFRIWKENFEAGTVEFSDVEKELLEKASRIIAKIRKNQSGNTPMVSDEQIPEKEIVTIAEINAGEDFYIDPDFYDEEDCMLVYKGDLHIKGNLDSKWYDNQMAGMTWENELYGIIVEGNLIVDGDITVDMPILKVGKDLSCDYLFSGDGHMEIDGDVTAKYGIYGEYNDGSLDIEGSLSAPYIIAQDHCMPRESSDGEFIYIEGGDGSEMEDISIGKEYGSGSGWGWYYYKDSEKLLSKSVQDEDFEFSVKKFFDIVKKGDNPFIEINN